LLASPSSESDLDTRRHAARIARKHHRALRLASVPLSANNPDMACHPHPDYRAILKRLESGPQTAQDISAAPHLNIARVNAILHTLQNQCAIQSTRCVPGNRPHQKFNTWELRPHKTSDAQQGRSP